jgi:tRNA(fMet)-specific endonuclease VapC
LERLVLDSSVWIDIERNKLALDDVLGDAYQLILPAVVAAELRYKFANYLTGPQKQQEARNFVELVESVCDFAPFDKDIVEKYVDLRSHCKREGAPRSVQDLMIAATAVAHGALLKSFDSRANFEELPNVRVLS